MTAFLRGNSFNNLPEDFVRPIAAVRPQKRRWMGFRVPRRDELRPTVPGLDLLFLRSALGTTTASRGLSDRARNPDIASALAPCPGPRPGAWADSRNTRQLSRRKGPARPATQRLSGPLAADSTRGNDEGWFTLNRDGTKRATEWMKVDTDGKNFWLTAKDLSNSREWGVACPGEVPRCHSDKFGDILLIPCT